MSFILDALKKSENERQRTVGPSLADAPARRQQSERPWWMVAVGALLVVNLGVLMIVLMRDKTSDAPKPVVAAPVAQNIAPPATPITAPPATATPPHTVTNPAVRPLAEEAGVSDSSYYEGGAAEGTDGGVEHPELAAAANVPAGPPIVRPINPPGVAPLGTQPTFQSRSTEAPVSDAELPTAGALIADGTSLPDMRLDIHVYSNNPSERFVFINMHRYSEGQRLSEGPMLERITPEGAILNSQGLRFILPRQ